MYSYLWTETSPMMTHVEKFLKLKNLLNSLKIFHLSMYGFFLNYFLFNLIFDSLKMPSVYFKNWLKFSLKTFWI